MCGAVRRAAGAAEAAAPDRKTHVPRGAAETGRDEGPPAKGAARPAGICDATLRWDKNTHRILVGGGGEVSNRFLNRQKSP